MSELKSTMLIVAVLLMSVYLAPTASSVALADVISSGTMNGLKLSPNGPWSWTGAVMNIPFKITNVTTGTIRESNIFFTGMAATGYGQLRYVKHATWEKKRGVKTLRAQMGLPTDMLPTDQEVTIVPGEPPDAEYPYLSIGTLRPGESRTGVWRISWITSGGVADHSPPYTISHCTVSGRRKTSSQNRPPTAYDAEVTTSVDTPVDIMLRATDPDGDDLIYAIVDPSNGTVTGTPPNVTYTPNAAFIGTDRFFFTVFDKKTEGNIATVTIMVGPGTVPVQYDLGVDDYGDLWIDGVLEAHYDGGAAGGDTTDVLDLTPGWHDIEILIKNRWGSSSVVLQQATGPGQYTVVPREHLRSLDAQGQFVSGLKAEYFTLGGTMPYKTVYGEGPIHHVSGGDTGYRLGMYQGVLGDGSGPPWVGLWDTFEERVSGQILIGN
jgi:hypothetical protein